MKIIVETYDNKEIELPDYIGAQDIQAYIYKEFGINDGEGTLHSWHIVEETERDQDGGFTGKTVRL